MFINSSQEIHANIIKTALLIVAEREFGIKSVIYKEVDKLKLDRDSKIFNILIYKLNEQGISEDNIRELVIESSKLLLSLDSPINILGEFIYSAKVRKEIEKHVNSFNNNKNKYDLTAILNSFKKFTLDNSTVNFNWDEANLVSYLSKSYLSFFSQDSRFSRIITSTLNNIGTVVHGEEGEMSLVDKVEIPVDEVKYYSIDFSNVVKDISVASSNLFKVGSDVIYDLFSYYVKREREESKKSIERLMMDCLGSKELMPSITKSDACFGSQYQINTVASREVIVDKILDTLDSGLTYDDVNVLYQEVKAIDASSLNNVNVSNLFSYPKEKDSSIKVSKIEKRNKEIFLSILKGIVSLKEFLKYLKVNKINFSDTDLFRDENNYKKFATLESYISYKEISKELSIEAKNEEILLPYYKNDDLHDRLSLRYNLSSLSSIYNEQISKIYSEPLPTKSYINRLNDLGMLNLMMMKDLEMYIKAIEGEGEDRIDANQPECFDVIAEDRPDIIETFKAFFDVEDCHIRKLGTIILEEKNIYNVLRFFNFSLVVFDHLKTLLEFSLMTEQELILNLEDLKLDFPKEITSIDDLSKLYSENFKLEFYGISQSNSAGPYIAKFYSSLFTVLKNEISDIVEFTYSWSLKLKGRLDSYGIVANKSLKFNSVTLRSKLNTIRNSPPIMTSGLQKLITKCSVRNGLLSQKGYPIVYEGFLVHEKGYLLEVRRGFNVIPITERQSFDLNKIELWRDVLWKV